MGGSGVGRGECEGDMEGGAGTWTRIMGLARMRGRSDPPLAICSMAQSSTRPYGGVAGGQCGPPRDPALSLVAVPCLAEASVVEVPMRRQPGMWSVEGGCC